MKISFLKNLSFLVLVILIASPSFAQTVYTQDFEGPGSIPAGWSQTSLASDGGWRTDVSSNMSSTYFQFPDHTHFIATNDDSCHCNKSADFLKSAPIDLRNNTYLYLSFDSYYYGAHDNTNHTESAVVRVSTDSGATWTTVYTVPGNQYTQWEKRYVNLSSFAGDSSVMIGFLYNDGGGDIYGWAIDNAQIFVPLTQDLNIIKAMPATGSFASFGMPGTDVPISFVVFNNSRATLSSFNANYTVDGVNKTQKVYASMAPYTYDTTSFFTPYNISSAGDHKVTVVVVGAGDVNLNNDTASVIIGGGAFNPKHTVVIEEATGCWCGWCPAGAIAMDSMSNMYSNNAAFIAVHDDLGYPNQDAMAFLNYDLPMAYIIGGYPTILADRKSSYDPAPQVFPAFAAYTDHTNDFGVADVSSVTSYNSSNRKATVVATVNFAVNTTNANAKLACVFTEDGVHGTASNYRQNNYYSHTVYNITLNGAGHNWASEQQYVSAASMYYNHVARTIVGGFTGTTAGLPTNIVANTPHTYTFTYIVPAGYDVNNMKAIVMLINPNTDEIFNASTPQTITGINDLKSDIDQLSIYPNPATNQLNILFSLTKPQSVVFQVTDIMGRQVAVTTNGNLAAANQIVKLPIDDLAPGIYLLNIRTGSGVVSRKFIKE